jgi:CheY-like chemotaxis protein
VVLDINLPDAPGWTVLETLKQDPATRQIPIAVCTVEDVQQRALALGADAFLQKPLDRAGLAAVVARWVAVPGHSDELAA